MGGPEVRGTAELARTYLAARGRHRPVLPVRIPGATFARFRGGDHLTPDHAVGRITFAQFLAERFRPDGQPEPGAGGEPGVGPPGTTISPM
jgi:hypothetical protein